MARMLVINSTVKAAIAAAVERARARPVPVAVTMAMAIMDDPLNLTLADRRPGAPERPPSQCLLLPGGYQVAFSFEEQPHGMVRHLSVAVNNPKPGKVPNPAAVAMIAEHFGFREFPPEFGKVWIEEYRAGHLAINVAELVDPPTQPPRVQ